jgi:DNA repair protein RadC
MQTVYSRKTMHEASRPREKALRSGLESLSDSELLALLIG